MTVSSLPLIILISAVSGGLIQSAEARPPEKKAEQSLLYWRYLCRGGMQEERIREHRRELKCLSQSWTVMGPEDQGRVEEIHSLD